MRKGERNILWLWLLFAVIFTTVASAQIDPVKRDLLQFGYNQPLEGKAPISGYAFYYRNQPDFLRTNMTLRLAIAPVYLDSELGFVHGLGPQTDFALGAAGGGFADSYYEIDGGQYHSGQSFEGHGGEFSASMYHLFNPDDRIPLYYILRGTAHYSTYSQSSSTVASFQTPGDGPTFTVRTGLRWGGIEPTLYPELAMELSVWYEGLFRGNPGSYGFNGDREIEPSSHLFWSAAALSYTLPESKQNFYARLVAGTTVNADRLSAYRLGGFLPLIAEYPLSLPGYYYQEFSARQFALLNTSYLLPIAPSQRWNLNVNAAVAAIDYLPGTGQPGTLVSGVGAGILYRAPSDKFRVIINYGYGFNAVRDNGRGGSSIGILLQFDLDKPSGEGFKSTQPNRWRGWNWLFGH
ncbi:MAG TPA: hypothetical protein VFF11_00350 [Candidatus Binatia bacterium]|nr:hypothetical protein [Candidatus Binatia bacterium]